MESNRLQNVANEDDRGLIDAFSEIDQMLGEAENMILASRSHSPFNPYLTRLPDDQAKVISDRIAELRTSMLCAVRELHSVPPPQPHLNLVPQLRASLGDAARILDRLVSSRGQDDLSLSIAEAQGIAHQPVVTHMRQVFAQLDRFLLRGLMEAARPSRR